uniref:Uncharacterized protein n=1 Tax=Rhizophora mucronata TaxID=61149 RepID=A0A2P2Q6U7_RHIMU
MIMPDNICGFINSKASFISLFSYDYFSCLFFFIVKFSRHV